MRLKILFFAGLREVFGFQSKDIEVDKSIDTIDKLVESMSKLDDGAWLELLKNKATYKVAVNHELCNWDKRVEDGDELAFFPPITGG
jgi:molybdopterin synthase sulfur carrier subunit